MDCSPSPRRCSTRSNSKKHAKEEDWEEEEEKEKEEEEEEEEVRAVESMDKRLRLVFLR